MSESEQITKKQKLDEDTFVESTQQVDEFEEFEWEKYEQNKVDTKLILTRKDCPFLGTIKRHMLDFDFEKLCSVTLSNLNVYACLVCGKYFQGRGKNTHAYFHSLEQKHHMFINLHNEKVYCLPDQYEVRDASLNDIIFNLHPTYDLKTAQGLDKNTQYSRGLDGTDYLPGFVGLNNLKHTDYVNVIIQSLARIPDLRNFFLFYESEKHASDVFDYQTLITKRFSELIRKIWNPKSFKGQVSPHELMQAIALKSNKRFKIMTQSDPIQLFSWLVDIISNEMIKTKNKQPNIIRKAFQGSLKVKFYRAKDGQIDKQPDIETKNFLFLTLDIPPVPLYQSDVKNQSVLPHQPIFNLLKKFNGKTFTEFPNGKSTYTIESLPKYLVFHFKRFSKNNFYKEKNPTIVSFPLNNLDLAQELNLDENKFKNCKYNLVANICHEGRPDSGFFKLHIKHKALNQWFEIQDLHIAPVMPQLVSLSEAYIQIYEQQIEE